MKKLRLIAVSVTSGLLWSLGGCASMQTALEHKNLKTQTKMSETIFLDPVAKSKRSVFVQIKNTSDKSLNITRPIIQAISSHGYRVVNNPNNAHYLLQANVLKVAEMSHSASRGAISRGFGSSLAGVGAGVSVGALGGTSESMIAGGLVGGALSMAADSLIKDVNYAMITDLQISERVKKAVFEQTQANVKNGISTRTMQSSSKKSNWQRYRTRIISSADKVNLKFAEAKPVLEKGLVKSISGIF